MFSDLLRIMKNRKLQQIQKSKIQKKKLIPVNTVEEELILQDNFSLENSETFTKSRKKIINL